MVSIVLANPKRSRNVWGLSELDLARKWFVYGEVASQVSCCPVTISVDKSVLTNLIDATYV